MVNRAIRAERSARLVIRFDVLLARKARRERRTISLRDVQAATGIGASTLVDWSKGRVTRLDADKLVALCDFMPCRLSELIRILPPAPDDGVHDSTPSAGQ